jgi:hypothetical protein
MLTFRPDFVSSHVGCRVGGPGRGLRGDPAADRVVDRLLDDSRRLSAEVREVRRAATFVSARLIYS